MEAAAAEFATNGIADVVTVMQRDIEGCGFPSSLHGTADGMTPFPQNTSSERGDACPHV